jgi:hypothetical protein
MRLKGGENNMRNENNIEHFNARRRLMGLALEMSKAKAALESELFGGYEDRGVIDLLIETRHGVYVEETGKMRDATDQEKRDAEFWIRAQKQYREGDYGMLTESGCPECGGDVEGDGESETDGCAQDWATFTHWSVWCIGAINREDVECDCDIVERQAEATAHRLRCDAWRAWETEKARHPSRTWVDPTCDRFGDCEGCRAYPRTCHQGHYLWPVDVEAEFASKEPVKPEQMWLSSMAEHGEECKRTLSRCGWSNSGSDLTASGGSF